MFLFKNTIQGYNPDYISSSYESTENTNSSSENRRERPKRAFHSGGKEPGSVNERRLLNSYQVNAKRNCDETQTIPIGMAKKLKLTRTRPTRHDHRLLGNVDGYDDSGKTMGRAEGGARLNIGPTQV